MAPLEGSQLRPEKQGSNFAVTEGEFDLLTVNSHDGMTYEVLRGKEFDKDRPTVIFYHGFLDTPYSWDHQIRYFQSQGYNVIASTLRGYQRTYMPKTFSFQDSANDIIALVEQMQLTETYLVGHDFGSSMVQAAAKERPDLFKKVMLVSVPENKDFEDALKTNSQQILYSWYFIFYQLPLIPELWFENRYGLNWMYNYHCGTLKYDHARVDYTFEQMKKTGWSGALGWYRVLVW